MSKSVNICLPSRWVAADNLDDTLSTLGDAHASAIEEVTIRIPNNCKVMVDAGVQLLSLMNQLAQAGKQVSITFDEGQSGTMGIS